MFTPNDPGIFAAAHAGAFGSTTQVPHSRPPPQRIKYDAVKGNFALHGMIEWLR